MLENSVVKNPNLEKLNRYTEVRKRTNTIVKDLEAEDFVPQPVPDVSPPKWHLAHTTWFFETFILAEFAKEYKAYHPLYAFLFNSYYEAAGPRILRTQRGNMTRPTTKEILEYRRYVDEAMLNLIGTEPTNKDFWNRLELGLNHEQQHQELLITDIKYILGHNPLFPAFGNIKCKALEGANKQIDIPEGIYEIGYKGDQFCYDNELGVHRVFLASYAIDKNPVSNREYLAFIENDGYTTVEYWLSEGWSFVKKMDFYAPMHWHKNEAGDWLEYTSSGLEKLNLDAPVSHVSYYEADAYARWQNARLPTEFEWETAHKHLNWGQVWEWTSSAYAPYPGFKTDDGALGEYNGKWMVNQMTLRGQSVATSPNHSRASYRNFFHPDKKWQFTGFRLCR